MYNSKMKRIIFAISFFLFLTFLFLLTYKSTKAQVQYPDGVVTQRLVVRFKPLVPRFFKERALGVYSGSFREELLLPDAVVLEVPESVAEQVARSLQKSLFISYAERDFVAEAF